jgi:hypothetical protein
MFFVEEEKADESLIPTLNKDRLLMPFASVDHYRARETHVKKSIYHHCMHYHATLVCLITQSCGMYSL